MEKTSLPHLPTRYLFHYEVETLLWKNPFDKSITDEQLYADQRRQNAYHDLKRFATPDPLEARHQAFSYLQSMLEVLCESVGKPYSDYWQAVHDLQPLLRADHPLAHQQVAHMQFDDDLLCGVTLSLVAQRGRRRDRVVIFSLGVYDDRHKEEILADVLYTFIELTRERRYYNLAAIPVETISLNLAPLGLPATDILPSPLDWFGFAATLAHTDLDLVLDTTSHLDRMCERMV